MCWVWKLDRLGRSLSHLVRILEDLKGRGVAFRLHGGHQHHDLAWLMAGTRYARKLVTA